MYNISKLIYFICFITLFIIPFQTICAIAIGIFNEYIIKEYIRELRPNGLGYGMPSTHMIIYTIIFISLITNNNKKYTFINVIVFIIILLTIWYKNKIMDHDSKQILYGILIGAICAIAINYVVKSTYDSYMKG